MSTDYTWTGCMRMTCLYISKNVIEIGSLYGDTYHPILP